MASITSRTIKFLSLLNRKSYLTGVRLCSSLSQQFEESKAKLNTLTDDPGNQTKLQLYALFKQASIGSCNVKKPGMLDIVGKAKWDAWNNLGSMTQDGAKQEYIKVVNELVSSQPSSDASPTETSGKYKCIDVSIDNKVRTIKFNRPNKKNAITFEMYSEIVDALNEAANDKDTVLTVTTGAGDYYCSGNDLGNFANVKPEDIKQMAVNGGTILNKFVSAFIDFPKPLIGVVNGPAVGITVTIMGLYDIVWAKQNSTFHTPFSSLGQTPEGCSSLTFPRLMGYAKASQLLMFDKKMMADEACQLGLVTEVFDGDAFDQEVQKRLQAMAQLPPKSLIYSKALIRSDNDLLHKVNNAECERLVERWQSDDCINAIMSFFQRKANK